MGCLPDRWLPTFDVAATVRLIHLQSPNGRIATAFQRVGRNKRSALRRSNDRRALTQVARRGGDFDRGVGVGVTRLSRRCGAMRSAYCALRATGWIIEIIRTRPLEAIVIALATIFVFTVWIAVGIPLGRYVRQRPMVRLHPPGAKRCRIMISTPAQYVGHVYAKDEAEAIDEAVKGFKIGGL